MKKYIFIICIMVMLTGTGPACAETNTPIAESDAYNMGDIFANHGSVMLIIKSDTGEILDANKAAAAFYGYSIEELRSMNISRFNVLSEAEIKAEMQAAVEQSRNYFIFQHMTRDDDIRDVEVYSYPSVSITGEHILFSIVHDITPRLAAERRVEQDRLMIIGLLAAISIILWIAFILMNRSKSKEKKLKQLYQSLFDNMREGFALHEIICDTSGKPVDYRFLEVNKAFEEITGLDADTVRNHTIRQVMPETEDHWIHKYGDIALKSGSETFTSFSKELQKYFNVSVYSPKPMQFAVVFTDITEQVLMNERIELERHMLETILEDTLSGYWDWNLVEGTAYYSPSLKLMLGYGSDELENSPETWKRLIFREDLPKVLDRLEQHISSRGKIPFYNEVRYHHKDGSRIWVIFSGRAVEWNKDDSPRRMAGCHINITEIKELEKQLRNERARFLTTLQSLSDGVISTDKNGRIDLMNAAAEKLTGWTTKEAEGLAFNEVYRTIDMLTRARCQTPVAKVFDSETVYVPADSNILLRKDLSELPIEESAAPIKDGQGRISGAVVVFRDFTEKKEKQDKIMYLSYHDQLTGLYNRRFFEEESKRLDTERNLPFTTAMIDVNGLKLTNDAFGHQMGDELLKRIAGILRRECRSDDIVARVGGDEFVILLPQTSNEEAGKLVRRIYRSVGNEQFESIVLSVSIGYETKTSQEQSISDIFAKAEEYMYRNKLTESQSMRNQTIQAILRTLHEKNERERIHSEKVSKLSRSIAEAMNMDYEHVKEIETAGLVHDIGKIALDETVLNKPGDLTDAEYEEIRRHPESGYHILKSVDSYNKLADYILSHHERWDGKGYPRGLSGEEIPLFARIIAVADSYEAMTSDRPYRRSISSEAAMEELNACAGTQFDPDIVRIFTELCPQ